jgi:hypothetical protein
LFNDVPWHKPAASSPPIVTFANTRGVSHKDVASLCLQQKVSALQTDSRWSKAVTKINPSWSLCDQMSSSAVSVLTKEFCFFFPIILKEEKNRSTFYYDDLVLGIGPVL